MTKVGEGGLFTLMQPHVQCSEKKEIKSMIESINPSVKQLMRSHEKQVLKIVYKPIDKTMRFKLDMEGENIPLVIGILIGQLALDKENLIQIISNIARVAKKEFDRQQVKNEGQ